MSRDDTGIGGPRAAFPETPASAVLAARSDDPIARARAFQTIVLAYWKPVYKAIRIRWRKSNEEAKDLTQAFFARALEKEIFRGYEPSRARFRSFVRTCLHNFVANEEEASRRLKRGGGASALSLDWDEAEEELASAMRSPAPAASFEDEFDRELLRSLHAIGLRDLRERLESAGKEVYFRVFELYDLAEDGAERPTYAAIAERLGLKVTDVTNYLSHARRELRGIVLARLRAITASEEEFLDEAREVLGIDPTEVVV